MKGFVFRRIGRRVVPMKVELAQKYHDIRNAKRMARTYTPTDQLSKKIMNSNKISTEQKKAVMAMRHLMRLK